MRDQEVWALHLTFEEAGRDSFYSPSVDDVAEILQYTQNNEGEIALEMILTATTTDIPDQLRERAYEVAELFAYEFSEDEVKASVDAWIAWSPESGMKPPYST